MRRVWLALTLLACFGCQHAAYKVHPGAAGYVSGTASSVQIVASQGYDTLVAADAVIQSTRADYLAGKFPATAMPAVKAALNGVINTYDVANAAWLTFNQAAAVNPSTPQLALVTALAGLNQALQQLATAKGGSL